MDLATRSRAWWNLERFGLTPGKLLVRLAPGKGPKVACISIPKAGTHLLERAICLHPKLYRPLRRTLITADARRLGGLDPILRTIRPWQVLVAHLRYDDSFLEELDRHEVRTLFLQRDPRDLVVSQAHYVARSSAHPHHRLFSSLPDTRARLELVIRGDRAAGVEPIGAKLASFAGWLDTPASVVRFEDLVGPRGSGTAERQRKTVEQVYRHVGLEPAVELIRSVTRNLFSDLSPTFRKGVTGQWKEAFNPEIKALFKEEAGAQLIRFGYERDHRW